MTLLLLLGALCAPTPSPAVLFEAPPTHCSIQGDYTQARAALGHSLTGQLEDLAARCIKGRAYLQRDLTYELLLTVAPEHKLARKTLRYKWDRKASKWTQKKYKAPKDRDSSVVSKLNAARTALQEEYAVGILELLDTHGGELSIAEVQEETEALIASLPNSPLIRGLLGQVLLGRDGEQEWVQASTARALQQRKAQSKNWKAALDQVNELDESEPDSDEVAMGIPWKSCAEGASFRVLSANDAKEAKAVAKKLEALTIWMHPLLGTRAQDEVVHVYLMAHEQGPKFLDEFPDLGDPMREDLKNSNGAFLGRADRIGVWNSHAASRTDQTIRLAISYALLDTYGRADEGWVKHGLPGWMDQGLGVYLAFMMNGTKLSVQLMESKYEKGKGDPGGVLQGSDEDWIMNARVAMTRKRKPINLAVALGRNTDVLSTQELYVTYGFSAWILEGHDAETTHAILLGAGQRENPTTVLERVLQKPFLQIEESFRQWLREIKHS